MTLVINRVVNCRYFPPGQRLLSQPKRSPRCPVPNNILPGDRGTRVQVACPRPLRNGVQPGLEPATCKSHVRHPTNSPTMSITFSIRATIFTVKWLQKNRDQDTRELRGNHLFDSNVRQTNHHSRCLYHRYMLAGYKDDYRRYMWIYPLKHRSTLKQTHKHSSTSVIWGQIVFTLYIELPLFPILYLDRLCILLKQTSTFLRSKCYTKHKRGRDRVSEFVLCIVRERDSHV